MSEGSSRAQMERRLIERSLEDGAFRRRLVEDPKWAVEQELGTRLPEEVRVLAVEETQDTLYLALESIAGCPGDEGSTTASTAAHPSGPTMSGLTSSAPMRSPRSRARTERRDRALASAATSAGGAPLTPPSSGRMPSLSMSRLARASSRGGSASRLSRRQPLPADRTGGRVPHQGLFPPRAPPSPAP